MTVTLDKVLRQFNGQRKYLNYFIAGFVDGEGSFSVAIICHPSQKFGWMINPVFQVYQHERHRSALEVCQVVFGTGNIYRKSGIHPVLNFSIDSRRSLLERVIPFFEKYPLLTKRSEFLKFREILNAMEQKEHQTKAGFVRLATLAYSMNQQGKGRKHPLEYIINSLP